MDLIILQLDIIFRKTLSLIIADVLEEGGGDVFATSIYLRTCQRLASLHDKTLFCFDKPKVSYFAKLRNEISTHTIAQYLYLYLRLQELTTTSYDGGLIQGPILYIYRVEQIFFKGLICRMQKVKRILKPNIN